MHFDMFVGTLILIALGLLGIAALVAGGAL